MRSRMNCLLSDEALEQKRVNLEIEKQLQLDERASRREVKILLIGTPEAGKSTFIKQLRILHGNGYSEEDIRWHKRHIYRFIFTVMQEIIRAMDILNIAYGDKELEEKAHAISAVNTETLTSFEEPHVTYTKDLWRDLGVQSCYRRRREFQLSDSTEYYLSNIDRLSAPDYVPAEDDIVRVRVPSTGIVEFSFFYDEISFRTIDVGGQRTERRKWIRCFENVAAIFFIAALSEYDEIGTDNKSRMEAAKTLFGTVASYPYFDNSSIIIFLNKKDLFDEKISHSHLVDYYPEYDGPPKDSIAAREFILRMFVEMNPDPEKMIYSHFITATNKENIRNVFDAVNYVILRHSINSKDLQ